MMKKRTKQVSFFHFLVILEIEIWLAFAFAFFLTIFLLFILERYSPYSYRNNKEKYRTEPDDRFTSLKECFWFAFTSLTPQGGGDIPKNLSGKVAAATWWLFGFVIVAAYTANLAAYETLDRLERNIESMDDLRKQYRVSYSVVADSATYRYFNRMKMLEERFFRFWRGTTLDENTPEWNRSKYAVWEYPLEDKFTKMYYAMEQAGFVPSEEQAVEMLRKVNRTFEFAFIAETFTVKYLMLTNCDFRLVGEEFGKKPFAFAVQKGSPLRKKINDAITRLMIQGKLNELEKKWWDANPLRANCPAEKDFNAGYGLDYLTVMFSMILVGILLAVLILCLEYFRHCCRPRRQNENVRLFVRPLSTGPKIRTGFR
ncbi:PREDICTED: glutamate receptor ionotropic, kainate 2-like [Dufourea novaeangliae]|uniref:glutamate receptor ionotropic, kainate 2-like n=1 Tax=Dufourea novaeangliae TaxID=178035 RepID=UPI000767096E|nr:PREDICTED: glutamate receptor ionotropic, kainate 2-like [Dufourea novaeangliae]